MRLLPRISALALAVLISLPARAQQGFPTPNPSVNVPGMVIMCPTAAGNYVPCGAPGARSPLPTAGPVSPATQYPAGAIPVSTSNTGTTAATTATLAAIQGKTTYLCGFSIRANATAAATGNATVTGLVTGTLNFTQWTAPLASGIGIVEPPIGPDCIPANAPGQSVAVVSAAPGSGGTVSVSAWGYQQ